MARMIWTRELDDELKLHAATGLPASKIGDKMGLTRAAVSGRAKRIGVRFHGTQPAHEENLRRARKAAETRKARQPEITAKSNATKAAARPTPKIDRTWATGPRSAAVAGTPPAMTPQPPGACTIHTLRLNSCRWPIGDGDDMTYCGHAQERGSYCSGHAKLAFVTAHPSGRKVSTRSELARSLRRYVA